MMTYHNYDFELSGISKVQVLIFISIFQKVILISQRINEKKCTFKQCNVQNDTRNLKNVKYKRDHMRHGTLPLILSNPSGIDRVRLTPPPPNRVDKLHVLTWGQFYIVALIYIIRLIYL